MMNLIIGSHVSYKKNDQLVGSVKEAISYGANTFMFYTGAPQNTRRDSIDMNLVEEAKRLMSENNIDINNVIIHAPYIVNLANENNFEFSINFLKQEIERAHILGIKKVVLHPGSHVGLGSEKGIENIASALNQVLKSDNDVIICLETMAGKGSECGRTFEEIKSIIDRVDNKELIGVCLDTCHINDAGYDLNDFDSVIEEFDKIIGIDKLYCVHVNDSKNSIGSHKDRHENIGYGTIGFENLIKVLYNEKLENIPKILETPYIVDSISDKKTYPPYKQEIEMIRSKKFNSNLLEDVREYYKQIDYFMKKKGFTLIELLAVIVVLAIIALIATPVVLNLIKTAKIGAAEQSANEYVRAVNTQIVANLLNEESINDGIYPYDYVKVNINGNKPVSGNYLLNDGKITEANFCINNFYIKYRDGKSKYDKSISCDDKENNSYQKYLCRKAKKLHKETCSNNDKNKACASAGYTINDKGTTITYGQFPSGNLKSGDAFTCDVNNDGIYDEETERFYYITDKDVNTAVLIYYSNVNNGIPDNSSNSFASYNSKWGHTEYYGPELGIVKLPNVEQWKLTSIQSRNIKDNAGTNRIFGFDYGNKAARYISMQEINSACTLISNANSSQLPDNCTYLLENTIFSNSNTESYGYWTESPDSSIPYLIWSIWGNSASIARYNINKGTAEDWESYIGVRPVIEVLKYNIEP